MNQLTVEERIEATWQQLILLGYTKEQFALDRLGLNASPNAPLQALTISRVRLLDSEIEVTCADHRVYERNLWVALAMMLCRLLALAEWGPKS